MLFAFSLPAGRMIGILYHGETVSSFSQVRSQGRRVMVRCDTSEQEVYYWLDHIALTDQMKIQISVEDIPNNSRDEAGIDAVEVFDVTCP